MQTGFYATLPSMDDAEPDEADMVWLVYDLIAAPNGQYVLTLVQTVYTLFERELTKMNTLEPGDLDSFIATLQTKLRNG